MATTSSELLDSEDYLNSLLAAEKHCTTEIRDVAERYKTAQDEGFHGDEFQTLEKAWRS